MSLPGGTATKWLLAPMSMPQAFGYVTSNADAFLRLLEIRRRDFPSLDKWGAKGRFERAIGDLVKKAAQQAEQPKQT